MVKSPQWRDLVPVYDERAQEYAGDGSPRSLEHYRRTSRKFRALVGLMEARLPRGGLILDAGAGDGRYAAWMLAREHEVVALDVSPVMVRVALRYVRHQAGDGTMPFLVGNAEALPFRSATFDCVVCAQVLEHLLDDDLGLCELARVLKPRGLLILATDNEHNTIRAALDGPVSLLKSLVGISRSRVPFPHKDYTLEELTGKLVAAGFQPRLTETVRWSLPSPVNRVRQLTMCMDGLEWLLAGRFGRLRTLGDIIQVVAVRES